MSQDPTEPLDDSVLNKLNQIITIVESMDSRGQQLEARMSAFETSVDKRLSALETKVDERLYDTRPIWERALAEITEMRREIAELRAGQEELRAGQEELRATMWEGFHKVERQLRVLSKDFLERRAEVDYLEDRIEKLESERA
ncbi:MAG: hypothetical protein L0229_14570 [Blastocatellia bacterium]|nr:hypothetical protein [Blastocatellia bacterium]